MVCSGRTETLRIPKAKSLHDLHLLYKCHVDEKAKSLHASHFQYGVHRILMWPKKKLVGYLVSERKTVASVFCLSVCVSVSVYLSVCLCLSVCLWGKVVCICVLDVLCGSMGVGCALVFVKLGVWSV